MSVSTIVLIVLLGVSAVVLLRILRGGLGSFDDTLKSMDKRIKRTEAELKEQALAIGREEQMRIMRAALGELLDLPGCDPRARVAGENGSSLVVSCSRGNIYVSYSPKVAHLASQKGRVLHGRGTWLVRGHDGAENFFDSLDLAVKHMRRLLHDSHTS